MPCSGCSRRRRRRIEEVEDHLGLGRGRARGRYRGDISRFEEDDEIPELGQEPGLGELPELAPSGDDRGPPKRPPRQPNLLRDRGLGPTLLPRRARGPGSAHTQDVAGAFARYSKAVASGDVFGADIARYVADRHIEGDSPIEKGVEAVSRFRRRR